MAFEKVTALSHPIANLADRVVGSAQYLKGYFDGNAQQLMQAHNDLIDDLLATSAAASIGAAATDGIRGDSVQEQLVSLKNAIDDVAVGDLPDGSIGMEKLSDEVKKAAIPKTVSVMLAAANWTQSGDVFRQTMTVSGFTSGMKADLDASAQALAGLEAPIVPVSDLGTLYAETTQAPVQDLTVQVSIYAVR